MSLPEKVHCNDFLYSQAPLISANHLIILNSESFNAKIAFDVWNSCGVKICADGGANRLYDSFFANTDERSLYIPKYIVGDLDSVREEVVDYYRFGPRCVLFFEHYVI